MRLLIAILICAAPCFAQEMPRAGYSTEGLQETRPPWKFNWDNPEKEWLLVTTDSQKAAWYIQLSSDLKLANQPKSYRKFWMKIDFSKVASEAARESKALIAVNCNADTFETLSQTWYMPNGQIEQTRSYPSQPIIPESVAATMAKRVCSH